MNGMGAKRLTGFVKTQLECEVQRLVALGLSAEAAWARIASYALARQSEAAGEEARKG